MTVSLALLAAGVLLTGVLLSIVTVGVLAARDTTPPESSISTRDSVDGLVCMYCGKDGFDDQDDLETHLDGHSYLARREGGGSDGQ